MISAAGILVLSLVAFGAASPANNLNFGGRIVGGEDAAVGQFPYQVSLRSSSNNRHFCGGSIISNRWIITACHCTNGQKAKNIVIGVGTINVKEGEVYAVEKIVNHDEYDGEWIQNDISLLKTLKDIEFNDRVKAIPINMSKIGNRESAVASGWGMTSYPGQAPETLQYIQVNTITNEECKRKTLASSSVMIYDGSICTLTKSEEGMCMGDSGGPLAINGNLVGLVSWGIPCGRGYPDVFTRVSEFSSWVQDKIANN